jgi:hypothetical protein
MLPALARTGDETLEERLVLQVLVVLLKVLLSGSDELDGGELVATLLEAADDLADEATLCQPLVFDCMLISCRSVLYLDAIWLHSDEAIFPSVRHSPLSS